MGHIPFACPTCGRDLLPAGEHGLRCSEGHFVNVAKEGHVHLLPPARKNKALEAEQDGVARASRAFYEGGGNGAQVEAVADEVVRALAQCPPLDGGAPHGVLNAGCGEGALLRTLSQRLQGSSNTQLYGTDTNKLAVRYAAKRQRDAQFAVCSPHTLPFRDGAFSVVVAMFAPSPWEEFCRVLRPGGAVIVARAGGRHLQEWRAKLRAREAAAAGLHAEPPKQTSAGLAENYVRVCTEEHYGDELASHLVGMTSWGAGASEAAAQRESLLLQQREPHEVTTVDLILSTHRVWLGTGGEPD